MCCRHWNSAAFNGIAQFYVVPWVHVHAFTPSVDFFYNFHCREQCAMFALGREERRVPLLLKLYPFTILSEALNMDVDSSCFRSETLSRASRALILHQLAMAFASVALRFFVEYGVFLHSWPFTWVARQARTALLFTRAIATEAVDVFIDFDRFDDATFLHNLIEGYLNFSE